MPDDSQKCRDVFALFSQYLDLELPPDACREIETHLADCPPCMDFAESLRSTVELCRRYRPSEMPAPLAQDAKQRLLDVYRSMLARMVPATPG